MIHKDANNCCFNKMMEKITELSADIAAQHKETSWVKDICCCLANQNWSLVSDPTSRQSEPVDSRSASIELALLGCLPV